MFHQWLYEYSILKLQMSLACRRNTYLWHTTNNNRMVPNLSFEVAKRWYQYIECSLGCVARSAVLLKPHVANVLLFKFCEQKLVQHGPISITIDSNGLSLLIFEEKWLNYAYGSKSAPSSDSIWMRRLFNIWVLFFLCPKLDNLACLHTCPDRNEFHLKRWFFFSKIGIFCKSTEGPLSEAKTNWMVN